MLANMAGHGTGGQAYASDRAQLWVVIFMIDSEPHNSDYFVGVDVPGFRYWAEVLLTIITSTLPRLPGGGKHDQKPAIRTELCSY